MKNVIEKYGSVIIDSEYAYYDIKELRKTFNSIRINPTEGDSLYKISSPSDSIIKKDEIAKLVTLFPSPCVKDSGEDIFNALKESGTFQSSNCSGSDLHNKEFFYFSDDKINTYPEIKWANGNVNIEKDYTGVVLSIGFGRELDEGTYKVSINTNDLDRSIENHLDFDITQWGESFSKNDDFTFTLKKKADANRVKSIWIHLFKKDKTNYDLEIRSITIRKL